MLLSHRNPYANMICNPRAHALGEQGPPQFSHPLRTRPLICQPQAAQCGFLGPCAWCGNSLSGSASSRGFGYRRCSVWRGPLAWRLRIHQRSAPTHPRLQDRLGRIVKYYFSLEECVWCVSQHFPPVTSFSSPFVWAHTFSSYPEHTFPFNSAQLWPGPLQCHK